MTDSQRGVRGPDPAETGPVHLEPVPTDDRRAILTGCALWAVALLGTLIWRDRLEAAGHGWWSWVCLAGLVLGALGVLYLQTHGRWGRR